MREYLEQIMHQSISERSYEDMENLPLSCKKAFELKILNIQQYEFIAAMPIEIINLTELRKMRIQLERYTGYRCAFYLKNTNWYSVNKMLEEGIPFVWENHQVYLPFMAMHLQKNEQRIKKNCSIISFLTQKLLLKALYENWQDISVTQAAERLKVSKMSVTRCYDEIEALGMTFLKMSGKSRRFHAIENKKIMWNEMRPCLRNPIVRIFRPIRKPTADMMLSGISALAEYSLLGDDSYVTYAVLKDQIGALGLKEIQEMPMNEEPICVIHEVGYILPFKEVKAVDPLSLTLMLSEEEISDPRVERCINEMLEDLVW